MKNSVKAGYIYKILPHNLQSYILCELSSGEAELLNQSIKAAKQLESSQKIYILKLFLKEIKSISLKRIDIIDRGIILSALLLSFLFIIAFVSAVLKFSSISMIIGHIERIFYYGGVHLSIFPFILSFIRTECNNHPMKILFHSKNYLFDIGIAILFSLIIYLLFLISVPSVNIGPIEPVIIFFILVSITIGPVVEELFFRYFIFMYNGEKYGYLICALLSSFIFSLVHLPDTIILAVIYFLSGIILCGICFLRKSIFPAFMTHSAVNLFLIML